MIKSHFRSKYNYNKETLNIPQSENYIISLDGSLLASINDTNNFSLYFLDDIGLGYVRCFYESVNQDVSALAFTNLSAISFYQKKSIKAAKKLGSNFQNSLHSLKNCGNQLVIAKNKKPVIQILDLTNLYFSDEIKINNPILSMKVDKFNSAQIFCIEDGTRNLIKYNLISGQNEIITNNVNFFEELPDGSLIISTETGIKYFDKQNNLLCIQQAYIKPLAFFSLSYQKVLMIGYTGCSYPSFMVFNPLSKKKVPIYKIPYFKINNTDKLFQGNHTFNCYNNGHKSFYISSSTSEFIVHCISEGDFYSIERIENIHFPVLAMHQIHINNGILAVFGKSKISLLKFVNDNENISNIYDLPVINKEIVKYEIKLEEPEDEKLKETYKLIKELPFPQPSNPLKAVVFLKSEADPILKSYDLLNKNIESVLKEQILAFNLSSELKNQPEWEPSDSIYFDEKIKTEERIVERTLKSFSNPGKPLPSFNYKFSFHAENTNKEDYYNSNKTNKMHGP